MDERRIGDIVAPLAALAQAARFAVRPPTRERRNRYAKPVPQKFQRKARLRRLAQQKRDVQITAADYDAACARVEADYRAR